jgi:flagellar hook-associated protein 3 FlgL
MLAAGNASYGDGERKGIAERAAIRSATSCSRSPTLATAPVTFVFGGQGSTQRPFIDTATGVQFAAADGEMRTEHPTGLPLTTDGPRAVWLEARTGNGVFVTSAAPGVPRRDDRQRRRLRSERADRRRLHAASSASRPA